MRRQFVTRGGILIGFVLSMVVYPVMGTLSPTIVALEAVPGVVLGDTPPMIDVVTGQGPQLVAVELPLPSIDDSARAIATSSEYVVSTRLPSCDGSTFWEGTNGNLTNDSLCRLWKKDIYVRSDAAVALAELDHQYKLRFGTRLCLISGYRSYGDQVRIKASKGWKAAPPGKSYHGWGLAIDLCRGQDRGESYSWLRANAPAFGWDNPRWAQTTKYEPWHWEYTPGTDQIGWYVSDESIDATLAAREAADAAAAEAEAAAVAAAAEPEPTATTAP